MKSYMFSWSIKHRLRGPCLVFYREKGSSKWEFVKKEKKNVASWIPTKSEY